jgi:hypothetical protein
VLRRPTLQASKHMLIEPSDFFDRLWIRSPSVKQLKSLYEYLIGKHIPKLIRKSVPYAYLSLHGGSSLGLYAG